MPKLQRKVPASNAVIFIPKPTNISVGANIFNQKSMPIPTSIAVLRANSCGLFPTAIEFITNKNIATCLYTAVSTDTGSFMYFNTTADTHLIAAELINNGADTDGLRENFFEGVSLKRFKLTKYAYQEVNFACDNLLAWIKIPYSFIREIGAKEEETEGVVGHIRNIKDVEVALLLKEREDGKIKGSLRSKKMIDVSKIAEIFGGGGHKRAAGFELSGTLEEAEEIIISELKKELKNV
jgi:phosphoesterase RecJ-like protein